MLAELKGECLELFEQKIQDKTAQLPTRDSTHVYSALIPTALTK